MTQYPVYALTVKVEGSSHHAYFKSGDITTFVTDVPFLPNRQALTGEVLAHAVYDENGRNGRYGGYVPAQLVELFTQSETLLNLCDTSGSILSDDGFKVSFIAAGEYDYRDFHLKLPPDVPEYYDLTSYRDPMWSFIKSQSMTFDQFAEAFDDNMMLAMLTQ